MGFRFRLGWVIVLLLLSASAWAAVRCVQCGLEIEGKPRVTSRGVFCSAACEAKATPRCATCDEILSGEVLVLGELFYCSHACLPEQEPARKCGACSKGISGKYLILSGVDYCSQACVNATLPKCHACSEPVESGVQYGDRIYCARDGRAPACGACGFPAVAARTLDDGRVFCSGCLGDTVGSDERARPLYRRAASEVEAITGLKLGELPPLELVTKGRLLEQGEGVLNEGSAGLYRSTRLVKTIDGKPTGESMLSEPRISLLSHMDAATFEAAAVHELMHHLMALHFVRAEEDGPQWLREGVAEYVSSIACRRAGRSRLAADMREKPPPYGNGLRWMQWRFGEDGWSRLRLWLATVDARRLPAEPQR